MDAQRNSLWFFPTRDNQWEVYHASPQGDEFVGVWPTRQEAYTNADRYAQEHGIPYKPETYM